MRICAIDIKGNDAIIVSVEGVNRQEFTFISPEIKKIKLEDALDQASLQDFNQRIHGYFNEKNFDLIVVRARAMKGKFAGGPNSFKIEGLIQTSKSRVEVIHAATIKAAIKNVSIDLSVVNAYQTKALELAVSQLGKG